MSQQKKRAAAEFSSDVKRHMAQGQQPHGGEEDLVFEDPFGDDMEDEEMVAPNPDTMLPQQVDSDDVDWSSSSSDEEMNDVAVCVTAATQALAIREDYFCQQRVIWSDHVTVLRRRSSFERNYRLDEGSFDHLLELLRSDLQVDALISTVRTGEAPISAEVVLHCTLRWLAGGSYLDICTIGHISHASFYRCLYRGVNAITTCPALVIKLPRTHDEIKRTAAEFAKCSHEAVFDGCVGCIDGMLVRIKSPSSSSTANVRSHFSGHYYAMNLNIQAICDAKSRFTYFAIAAPGGSSDIHALRQTSLSQYINSLPCGRYVIGDCAYVPSEHVLTPFGGTQKQIPKNDSYNFYLSQLRIKIEQAFGLMTTKWWRLRSPLQMDLKHASKILVAMSRLHNYCIDHRQYPSPTRIVRVAYNVGYIPSQPPTISVQGISNLRERMVEFIADSGLSRPQHNLVRRRRHSTEVDAL